MKIMLVGRSGTGKDTVAKLIWKHHPEPLFITSLAEGVKLQVAKMLDHAILENKLPSSLFIRETTKETIDYANENRKLLRPLWQWYGTDFVRAMNKDYWVQDLHRRTLGIRNIIVTDGRFLNESQYAREQGYVILRVSGPDRRAALTNTSMPFHISETQSDEVNCDFTVDNTGDLDELDYLVQYAVLPFVYKKSGEYGDPKIFA